jgi:hypothetical protein
MFIPTTMEIKMTSELNDSKSLKNNQIQHDHLPVAMRSPLYVVCLFTLTLIPFFIHNQWITGVLVNFILVLSCLRFSFQSTLPLAFIPSMAAIIGGLIPIQLITFIPFIITANIILVIVIQIIKEKSVIAVCMAALSKFIFLYCAANYLTVHFLPEMFVNKLILLMSWHQFATALVGGLFALSIIKGLSYTNKQ